MKRLLLAIFVFGMAYAGIPYQKFLPPTVKLTPAQIGKGADLKGHADRRAGIHDGNRIRLKFFNTTVIGGPDRVNPWPRLEWPAGSGHEYIYELGPLFGARVKAYDPNTQDSVWISILDDPIQDGGDEDLEPLPGYFNPNKQSVAFSDKDTLWPQTWPAYVGILGDTLRNLSGKWAGQFNFIPWDHNGNPIPDSVVVNVVADQESYFAATDSANTEFMPGNNAGNPYYDPGNNMNGLGIKVVARGYQWTAQPVQDVIVWVYEVTNLSDKDIDSMVIGYYTDVRIGGPGSDFQDDMYGFDTTSNMVYFFDQDGYGRGADGRPYKCGWLGFKFLESPGNPYDRIDNDNDGMVDERQNDGIDNDDDWDPTKDDVGRDGIAGTGDYGENDGQPTLGEPHFEVMDPDEKDELGLTSVRDFVYGTGGLFAANDSAMISIMRPGVYQVDRGPGDFVLVFGSGFFPLHKGETQRFSIALVMGADSVDLYKHAFSAQVIFNRNYHFPKPPEKPQVWARTESGKVHLYWDNRAELNPEFEGYAIFRSQDRGVTWGTPITDAFGRIVYWRPIAQFDKIDSITGLAPVGVDGAYFYLGDDSGLRHSWTDTTVVDGEHYWYAVTAYAPGNDTLGLPPLISSVYPINANPSVVHVIPNGNPIGYHPPQITIDSLNSNINGTGQVDYMVVTPEDIKDASYYIKFDSTGNDTTWSLIKNVNGVDSVLISNSTKIHGEDDNPIVDGFRVSINTDTLAPDTNYFVRGNSNFHVQVSLARGGIKYPADYEIEFADSGTVLDSVFYNSPTNKAPVNFRVWRIEGKYRYRQEVVFIDGDHDGIIANPSGRDVLYPVLTDSTGRIVARTWKFTFMGPGTGAIPPNSDSTILYLKFHKPFTERDTIYFDTHEGTTNKNDIVKNMNKIKVVPNPYILVSAYELKDPTIRRGRGAREIHFINLPPEATIRIYTITGELVDVLHHVPGDPEYVSPSVQKWNLLNKDSQEIAYGVYIYHVEAMLDGQVVGKYIGKFAVIK